MKIWSPLIFLSVAAFFTSSLHVCSVRGIMTKTIKKSFSSTYSSYAFIVLKVIRSRYDMKMRRKTDCLNLRFSCKYENIKERLCQQCPAAVKNNVARQLSKRSRIGHSNQ